MLRLQVTRELLAEEVSSFATDAGTAAAILSVNPGLSYAAVKNILMATVDKTGVRVVSGARVSLSADLVGWFLLGWFSMDV